MINVFFDMDGTLIDSANAISCAVNEIRNELNLSPLSREKNHANHQYSKCRLGKRAL